MDAVSALQSPGSRRSSENTQPSEDSQTAADIIRNQLRLEAEAREALPYRFETCTYPLGPLRQSVFACLTCHPVVADCDKDSEETYREGSRGGICYACSIQCHGDHTLVEIFTKRKFTCDCGTTRFGNTTMPRCTLRRDPAKRRESIRSNSSVSKRNGDTSNLGVEGEEADKGNSYNQNFLNRFCCCSQEYDPYTQKGTMFQCLGLGTREAKGCGEDWFHPGCLVGLGPTWWELGDAKRDDLEKEEEKDEEKQEVKEETETNKKNPKTDEASHSDENKHENGKTQEETKKGGDANGNTNPAQEVGEEEEEEEEEEEPPMPPGFPEEDDFEAFLCYRCVEANPWIKKYAGQPGFLPAVFTTQAQVAPTVTTTTTATTMFNTTMIATDSETIIEKSAVTTSTTHSDAVQPESEKASKKRSRSDSDVGDEEQPKKLKVDESPVPNGDQEQSEKTEEVVETSKAEAKESQENDEKQTGQEEVKKEETREEKETVRDEVVKEAASNDETSQRSKDASCKWASLPEPPLTAPFSLFLREDFRSHFCLCTECLPRLEQFPQLLDEEETYEPSVSDADSQLDREGGANGAEDTCSEGSLYERGESALRNMDRVRALEGVMAYSKMKEQLLPFFEKFARSGEAISAEDIKDYFAKMRGDDASMQEARLAVAQGRAQDEKKRGEDPNK